MKITINDNPIDRSFSDKMHLGDVLNIIQSDMVSSQDVITTIHINGQELQAGQLTEWQDRFLCEFKSINIEIMAKTLFASSGLRIMAGHLEESEALRNQVVDALAQGQSQKAMQLLSDYLQLWDMVQKTLISACHLMDVDLENTDFEIEGIKVSEVIARLTEQLEQIKMTLEAGDSVMLGDIMDYEFGEICEGWCVVMHQLSDQFEQRDDSSHSDFE